MSAQRFRRTSQSTPAVLGLLRFLRNLSSPPSPESGVLLSPGVLLLLIPLTKDLPVVEVVLRAVHEVLQIPGLKGSIGEGPNNSNFSDRSPVRILSKFKNFR